jgi:cbb3-type cytochrome oxidase subunit 1
MLWGVVTRGVWVLAFAGLVYPPDPIIRHFLDYSRLRTYRVSVAKLSATGRQPKLEG